MEITNKIEGLSGLQKSLKSLSGKVERKISRSAVGKAGTLLLKEARAKAPVRTGALRRALTKRVKNVAKNDFYSVQITVRGGVMSSHRTAKRRGVGADYHPDEVIRYYRFLELGTKHNAAQPFLAPIVETKGKATIDFLGQELGQQIEKAAKR